MIVVLWIAAGAVIIAAALYAMLCAASDYDDQSEKFWRERHKR